MRTSPKPAKGLRIASGCSTLDEFTGVFRKFCSPNGIFIATKAPRSSGIETRFAITLKDGKPIMRGTGMISASFEDANNVYARPGMVIEFTKLDPMGRILLDELNAGTSTGVKIAAPADEQDFEVPTIVSDPDVAMLSATRRSQEMPALVDPSELAVSDDTKQKISVASAPLRAQGSRDILPANPFGELAASSLEAFVECTLYEETGETDISGLVAELNVGGMGRAQDLVPSFRHPMSAFDSAPDALDNDEARSIAAAQVAEDHRPKFVPHAPKLPGVSITPVHLKAATAVSAQAIDLPTAAKASPEPPQDPDQMPQYGVLEAQLVTPAPEDVIHAYENVSAATSPLDVHALSTLPMLAPRAMDDMDPEGASEFDGERSGVRLSVTRKQVIAIGALCLVAGLGFGLLFGGGRSSGAARNVASASVVGSDVTVGSDVAASSKPAAQEPAHAKSRVQPLAEAAEPTPVQALADSIPSSPADSVSSCAVLLNIVPADGVVTIGSIVRTTEEGEMLVPCGAHQVTIVHPRYQDYSGPLVAIEGQTTTLRARLSRPTVYLQISSTPSKAQVTINSRIVGKTPGKFKVPAFETATVQVVSPGYQSYSNKLYAKQSTTLKASLRKIPTKSPKSSSKKKSTPAPKRPTASPRSAKP